MSGWVTTFGELSVRFEGQEEPVDIGGPKPRLLLALLVIRANSAMHVDELIDALWQGRPPRSARKNLQVYVSRLRRILGDRIGLARGGYLLRLGPEECDVLRFEQLARDGRRRAREGDPAAAVDLLDRALTSWGGRPLAEFGDVAGLAGAADRLEELYLCALEEWADLEAARGGHRRVLDRLQDQAPAHPLRERLAAAWIRSLAATGREAEALAHFETVRRALAQELGVTPGPALTVVQRGLLRPPATPARGAVPGNQLPRDLPDFVGRRVEIREALRHFGVGEDGEVAADGERAWGASGEAAGGSWAGGGAARERFAGAAGHRGGAGRRGGVLVVNGPVGVGKTAFAVHVAHRLAPSFPDGLVMAEVGNRPLGAVLRTLLDSLGLPAEGTAAQALARWRSWVAGRRLLLIVDDAVSGHVVRELLPGCGPSGTIVTSRYRLSGVEAVARVGLPALDTAAGLDLLDRIINSGRVGADPAAAREIVARCEGLPLALRIAGAKLDALRHVGLADYARRLGAASSLLDEMAAGELVMRERYDAFWRDLPEAQRGAYRRVAAAPQGARTSSAEAEALLECHLLLPPDGSAPDAGTPAYRMSAFAADFARTLPPG